MNRDAAEAIRAGTDHPRAAFLDQQRIPGDKRVLLLVDRGYPAAFQNDEQDIELGVRVCEQLMTGRPRQEGRVQVAAGEPPQRTRP